MLGRISGMHKPKLSGEKDLEKQGTEKVLVLRILTFAELIFIALSSHALRSQRICFGTN